MRMGFLATVGLLLLGGCVMAVGQTSPRPNVFVDGGGRTLALSIWNTVRDEYKVPSQSGLAPIDVKAWRTTLTAGFRNGFGGGFEIADSRHESDLTIELIEARLEVVPTAWNAEGDPVAVAAQVRFKAQLLDASGQVLRRSARTVASKIPATDATEVSHAAGSAVEAMYEQIATDLFPDP